MIKGHITPELQSLAEECVRDLPDLLHDLVSRTREEMAKRIQRDMEASPLPPMPSVSPFNFFPSTAPEYGAKPRSMKHFFHPKK